MSRTTIALVAALCSLCASVARAQQCNSTTLSLTAQTADITMAVGEAAGTICFLTQEPPGYQCSAPIPSGVLGACHHVSGATDNVFTTLSGCTTTTSSTNRAVIHLGKGDDFFRATDRAFKCTESSSLPFPSSHILPWNPNFSFGLQVSGRGGADVIAGSPRSDILMSAFRVASSGKSVDDDANDLLCGGDGKDTLYGDDDSGSLLDFERMDGGPGSGDFCDGYGSSLNAVAECEVYTRAAMGTVNEAACFVSVADILE